MKKSIPKTQPRVDVKSGDAAIDLADAVDRMDARLDFAAAILDLMISTGESESPGFCRLNSGIQFTIFDGLRTLIEDAKHEADTAFEAGSKS